MVAGIRELIVTQGQQGFRCGPPIYQKSDLSPYDAEVGGSSPSVATMRIVQTSEQPDSLRFQAMQVRQLCRASAVVLALLILIPSASNPATLSDDAAWMEWRRQLQERAPLESFELPVVADSSLVDYRGERDAKHGHRRQLRIKNIQHFWIGKVNAAFLRGYSVVSAELRLKPSKGTLLGFVDSSCSTDWLEHGIRTEGGTRGGVTFESPTRPPATWAGPGTNVLGAIFGAGGSVRSRLLKRVQEDEQGFNVLALAPAVMQAQILDSHGIVIADGFGQVPGNKDVWSRETWRESRHPRVTLRARRFDTTPPARPLLTATANELEPATVTLTIVAPGDDGMFGQAFGYDVSYADGQRLPRYQIDRPVEAGRTQNFDVTVPVELLGRRVSFRVLAYDAAGNHSSPAVVALRLPVQIPLTPLIAPVDSPAGDPRGVIVAGTWRIRALDDSATASPVVALDRVGLSPVWDGTRVRLRGARNEILAFQILLEGRGNVRVAIGDLIGPDAEVISADPNIETFRVWYVADDAAAWHAANALPLPRGNPSVAIPAVDNAIPDQRTQAVWADLYIPKWASPGRYETTISVGESRIPLELDVWAVTLPDEERYRLELNGYGLVPGFELHPDSDAYTRLLHDTHRLARKHRGTVNLVPYHQSGRLASVASAPRIEGEGSAARITGWADYDRRQEPLFDGTAFTAANGYHGPGAGRPVSHAYLPLHENWPVPLEDYYRAVTDFGTDEDGYLLGVAAHAERAPPIRLAWKPGYAEATRQIAAAFAAARPNAQGWHHTRFQFYLNNKYSWKQSSRWRGQDVAPGSSYWLLDEPRDRADFHALAWYHRRYREGVEAANAPNVRFEYRADISRPQYDWRVLDDSINVYAVSGAFYRYRRLVQERVARTGGEAWLYGGGGTVAEGPLPYRLLILRSWLQGIDGILPTYTAFAGERGWDSPERLADCPVRATPWSRCAAREHPAEGGSTRGPGRPISHASRRSPRSRAGSTPRSGVSVPIRRIHRDGSGRSWACEFRSILYRESGAVTCRRSSRARALRGKRGQSLTAPHEYLRPFNIWGHFCILHLPRSSKGYTYPGTVCRKYKVKQ